MSEKLNLSVFASGEGSNFLAIAEACKANEFSAEVQLLVVNKPCPAIEKAQQLNIPFVIINPYDCNSFEEWDTAVLNQLSKHNIEFILLAGFIKKIGPKVISAYKNKILNIHPALLPKFGGAGMYGMNVHKAVIDSGDLISGSTVHKVNINYDEGDIVSQVKVAVLSHDTPQSLCEKVKSIENKFYVSTLKQYLTQISD